MHNFHRHVLFAAVVLALTAAPAWAGEVCDTAAAGENGNGSAATGSEAFACGVNNEASAFSSVAVGAYNEALEGLSVAVGIGNHATGSAGVAFGAANWAAGSSSSAFGHNNRASGYVSAAVGNNNLASGQNSIAFGHRNHASARLSSAFGMASGASAAGSLTLGGWFDRNGDDLLSLDVDANGDGIDDSSSESAQAMGVSSVAVGAGVHAGGTYSSAFGVDAHAYADGSTAIGFGARADRANTVSVGAAGNEHQIVNVAAGTQLTDAVNLSQLQSTLATANAYTDTVVATGGTATNAYTDNREAAIRTDLQAGDAATLSSANAYTDTRLSQLVDLSDDFDALRGEVDRRLQHQDDRIDRTGALGAAMIGMVASAAAVESGQTRIGIAAGSYGGKQALSLGLQRRIGGRAAMTLGGAFSGSERSATLGVGFGF